MFVFASSQNPAETQAIVAEVLGIAKNEVDVEIAGSGWCLRRKGNPGQSCGCLGCFCLQMLQNDLLKSTFSATTIRKLPVALTVFFQDTP